MSRSRRHNLEILPKENLKPTVTWVLARSPVFNFASDVLSILIRLIPEQFAIVWPALDHCPLLDGWLLEISLEYGIFEPGSRSRPLTRVCLVPLTPSLRTTKTHRRGRGRVPAKQTGTSAPCSPLHLPHRNLNKTTNLHARKTGALAACRAHYGKPAVNWAVLLTWDDALTRHKVPSNVKDPPFLPAHVFRVCCVTSPGILTCTAKLHARHGLPSSERRHQGHRNLLPQPGACLCNSSASDRRVEIANRCQPQYVEQSELEKFDGVSRGKYTIGLGQTKMSFCDDREGV